MDRARVLLEKWNEKAKLSRDLHYVASVRLRRWHYWVGIPTIILSASVSTAVFATVEQGPFASHARVMVGVVSVAAAVLAALQTFFRFHERAELHRAAAVGHDSLSRQIEQTLAEETTAHELSSAIELIRKRMDELGQAPELSDQDLMSVASVSDRPPAGASRPLMRTSPTPTFPSASVAAAPAAQ